MQLSLMVLILVSTAAADETAAAPRGPLLRTVDLDRGEMQDIELSDGKRAKVRVRELQEYRDGLRSAIREARVKVEVNGQTYAMLSPLTSKLTRNSSEST